MERSNRCLRFCDPSQGNDRGWDFFPAPHIIAQNLKLGVRVYYASWIRHDGVLLYRQPVIAEIGGAATLVADRASGRFCMARVPRPYAYNVEEYRASFPDVDPMNLGCMMWEAPRGLSKLSEKAAATAVRETEEETGFAVLSSVPLGKTVSNSTYFPQPTEMFLVEVDLGKQASCAPDTLEGIAGIRWFSLDEYDALHAAGECVDATTAHLVLSVVRRHAGLLR